tara:strand:+ start:292 stop:498 length:207 start_codon:yes stop_codon:yes gene_type:complete
MTDKMARRLIITDDTETFTKSTCDCEFCDKMHSSSKEWATFIPETNIQKNMLAVVAKIEKQQIKEKYL